MSGIAHFGRLPIPSVDRVLQSQLLRDAVSAHGRVLVTQAVREALEDVRKHLLETADPSPDFLREDRLAQRVLRFLEAKTAPSLRPVFNLSGTVLHTNLGRASLPSEAVQAIEAIASQPCTLEFDSQFGGRGHRDVHLERWLTDLTGAEAATVVNNNAAAVLLVLNTLALGREVPVSRGELVEIGGSFRMPDIMARAGCRLVEVGTTNRTYLRDFSNVVGRRTGLLMKVHTSNYEVEGFVHSVPESDLAELAARNGVPFVVDLGSGALVDLRSYGLPSEPTPAALIASGADLVTFSCDKLLGGPQAGVIAGRGDLVRRIRENPVARALRVDKLTIAALNAVLRLYLDPDRLAERLPTLKTLTRELGEIRALAERVLPFVTEMLPLPLAASVITCSSQIGSGSLPTKLIPSVGIAVEPPRGRASGGLVKRVAATFRALPSPVIGRVVDGRFLLDLRTLYDEEGFIGQLPTFTDRWNATL